MSDKTELKVSIDVVATLIKKEDGQIVAEIDFDFPGEEIPYGRTEVTIGQQELGFQIGVDSKGFLVMRGHKRPCIRYEYPFRVLLDDIKHEL